MLPREKMLELGEASLTNLELLTTIIGSGSKKFQVQKVAAAVLELIESKNSSLLLTDLKALKGIGLAKACQIFAALELGRRRHKSIGEKIISADKLIPYLSCYANKKQEHFLSISLNGAHEIIEVRVVSIGLLNSTPVHPREVFADPLMDRACSVIVAHNHPSGNLEPSAEDLEVTKRLHEAAKLLGIKLLDHIIFSSKGYYSFAEQGLLSRL